MALLNRTNVTASSIRLSAAAASVAVTATIDYDEKPLAAEAQAILNTLSAYKHPLTRASPGASVEAVDGAILTQALKELLSPPLSPSPQAPRMAMPAMPPSRPSQTGKEEASSSGTQDKSPLKKREESHACTCDARFPLRSRVHGLIGAYVGAVGARLVVGGRRNHSHRCLLCIGLPLLSWPCHVLVDGLL